MDHLIAFIAITCGFFLVPNLDVGVDDLPPDLSLRLWDVLPAEHLQFHFPRGKVLLGETAGRNRRVRVAHVSDKDKWENKLLE